MKYELKLINADEVVDTIEANSHKDAKLFFMGRKQMDEDTFDTLFIVIKKTN